MDLDTLTKIALVVDDLNARKLSASALRYGSKRSGPGKKGTVYGKNRILSLFVSVVFVDLYSLGRQLTSRSWQRESRINTNSPSSYP